MLIICDGLVQSAYPQDGAKTCSKTMIERYTNWQETERLHLSGDTGIDVFYYKLDLVITHDPDYVAGTVTVGIKPVHNNLENISLDLAKNMTVNAVRLAGKALAFNQTKLDQLYILLNRTYTTNESFLIEISYEGKPESQSALSSFVFGTHDGLPVIWSFSQPYGAKDWWPCKDTPADKADSADVWITCGENMTAVSNGNLEAVIENGDGTHTFRWRSDYPIAHYLISLAVSDYAQYSTYFHYSPNDSMPVTHYVYPEHFTSLKVQLDKTTEMLEIFSTLFGLYPFIDEKYGHAQCGMSGGMEHQTVSSMAGTGHWSDELIAHELAHQWFGDKVTCRDWHHVWLNEGFATYASILYFEAIGNLSQYHAQIESKRNSAKSAVGSVYVKDISSFQSIFNYKRSYAKSAMVLHMLRGIVGDDMFFQILQAYLDEPELTYNVAVTEDFQRVAERVSGTDLNYFFNQWIYGNNHPRYDVEWRSHSAGYGVYDVEIRIIQDINDDPAFFTMPIQVNIQTASGDTLVTLFNNAQSQVFTVPVDAVVTGVEFDPGNWILKDATTRSRIDTQTFHPEYLYLEQNYPNPFNPETTIKYSVPDHGVSDNHLIPVSIKIYNINGREVATLIDEMKLPGEYEVKFSLKDSKKKLNSGVYFYRLRAGDSVRTKKMMVIE